MEGEAHSSRWDNLIISTARLSFQVSTVLKNPLSLFSRQGKDQVKISISGVYL